MTVTIDDGASAPVTVSTNSNGSGDWTFSGVDVSALSDGSLSITVASTDVAGNTGNLPGVTVSLQSSAPAQPTVTAQTINSTTPVISGTATLSAGGTLVVLLNGVTYSAGDGNLVDNGDGSWTLSVPVGDALAEGLYDVAVTVTDAAGNSSVDSTTAELRIDTTAPAVATVTAQISATSTPSLSGTATIGAGEVLTVELNGATYTAGDGDLLDNGDGTWTLTVPGGNALADGSYEVAATLTDAAGNTSTDVSSNELLIDTTAPAAPSVTVQTINSASRRHSNAATGRDLTVTLSMV